MLAQPMTATPSLLLGACAFRTFGTVKSGALAAAPTSAAPCLRKRRRLAFVLGRMMFSLSDMGDAAGRSSGRPGGDRPGAGLGLRRLKIRRQRGDFKVFPSAREGRTARGGDRGPGRSR